MNLEELALLGSWDTFQPSSHSLEFFGQIFLDQFYVVFFYGSQCDQGNEVSGCADQNINWELVETNYKKLVGVRRQKFSP